MSEKVNYFHKESSVPFSQIVGHELLENYYRTHNKDSYNNAHSKSNEKYYGGIRNVDPIDVKLK